LNDVGDRRRSRTLVAVIVQHIGKHAGDARAGGVLYEHVAVISITADGRENHGDVLRTEKPARLHASRIIVDAADRHIATEIDSARYRLFKPEPMGTYLRCYDAFRLKIPGERDRFVLTQILYIESLSAQVAGLDHVIVEQRDPPDSLPHERWRDLGDDPTRTDAQHVTAREHILIESGDLSLAVFGSGDCRAPQFNRSS
jgi:hypothetical protein